jgi:hypothetical protein
MMDFVHRTYPVTVPIRTNRGNGQTRSIGPTRITFATAALFESGEPLRFAISLRGTGTTPIEVVGFGSVQAVRPDGDLFVVDATVDGTQITLAEEER